jgi:LmbE family N-acetylglucosaminyl deacetylase
VNALALVAHPDDELLFAGALMAARSEWTWQAVALTGGERAAQFPGLSLGFADEWRIISVPEARAWKAAVDGLDLSPDVVVTHNRMGEYGHPHHMTVHKIAHELYPNVWDFLVDAETSVGYQVEAQTTTRVPVTPEKEWRFEQTYPGVLSELRADRPEMIDDLLRVEQFTGPGYLP